MKYQQQQVFFLLRKRYIVPEEFVYNSIGSIVCTFTNAVEQSFTSSFRRFLLFCQIRHKDLLSPLLRLVVVEQHHTFITN